MKRSEGNVRQLKLLNHVFVVCLLTLGILFSAVPSTSFAKPETNVQALEQMSRDLEQKFNDQRGPAFQKMKAMTTGPEGILNSDPKFELMGIDENGRPIYYMKDNINAARTLRTDQVQPTGDSGFNLTGSNIFFMAIWDGGSARTSHQEFGGRIIVQDGSAMDDHATHVAGTMIASGVRANAKGMATEAYVYSYNWQNDDSEMASAAAGNVILSNHSYGRPGGFEYTSGSAGTGWYWYGTPSYSETEDYEFGRYNGDSRTWDVLAHNAPNYTIVKSAGNHRGEGPASGGQHWVYVSGWQSSTAVRERDGGSDGYDCMSHYSVAKNIITCGAVYDVTNYTGPGSVSISSFSSFGPTDDGRIKPDIVANGVGVYSSVATSNTSYESYDGTSMSAPNLTGSIALVVKYYRDSHSTETPLSSTVKDIMIHTAREAGPAEGPDYRFGWGLADTRAAVEFVQKDSALTFPIQEIDLENGSELVFDYVSNGEEPAKVTIVWNDPAGFSGGGLNNRTPRLTHDLDLRLVNVDTEEEFFPYILDVENPAHAAERGDNILDNVEQVYIESPVAGEYEIRVSHKATLRETQTFSMCISGLQWMNDPRVAPSNVQAAINYSNGDVALTWDHVDPPAGFSEFRIYRDDVQVGTSTEMSYTDNLTEFGVYTYEVRAFYTEDGESPFNEEVEAWYIAPAAPDFVGYNVQDEDQGRVDIYWKSFISEEVLYDDNEAEATIVLGSSFDPGAKLANRMTAPQNGHVANLKVNFNETVSNPLGQVKLLLYAAGETTDAPGELIFSTGVITLTEEGWLVVPVAVPYYVEEGQDYWVGVEWVETGRSEVFNDTSEPSGRGYLATDGSTWQSLEEVFAGFLNGNPLIRVDFGDEYSVGDFGLTSYDVLRDGTPIAEGITNNSYAETLPGTDIYEYVIKANFEQGVAESSPLSIDPNNLDAPEESIIPSTFQIGMAYPNPFNPSVSVPVTLTRSAEIKMVVFDILGRQVTEINRGALKVGRHTLNWNADGLASGVYFLNIQAGNQKAVRKVVLMR